MKKRLILAFMLSAAVLFNSCGSKDAAMDHFTSSMTATSGSSSNYYDGGEKGYYDTDLAPEESMDYLGDTADDGSMVSGMTSTSQPAVSGRKLIKDADIDMQTLEFDTMVQALQDEAVACGGYVESMSLGGKSYYYSSTRSADFVLRIPAAELNGFTLRLGELGYITWQSERVQDVTSAYLDIESRMTALRTEQATLLELMDKAENMADLLEIQARLTEVNYQLEGYQAKLNNYDDLIAYSTVRISVQEVERVSAPEPKTFWEEAMNRLSDSLYDLKEGIRDFGVFIIGDLPFIIIWIAVIVVGCLILVRLGKKLRAKRIVKKPAPKAQEPKDEE